MSRIIWYPHTKFPSKFGAPIGWDMLPPYTKYSRNYSVPLPNTLSIDMIQLKLCHVRWRHCNGYKTSHLYSQVQKFHLGLTGRIGGTIFCICGNTPSSPVKHFQAFCSHSESPPSSLWRALIASHSDGNGVRFPFLMLSRRCSFIFFWSYLYY